MLQPNQAPRMDFMNPRDYDDWWKERSDSAFQKAAIRIYHDANHAVGIISTILK